MEKISDYGIYTDGMRKSMTDKTWFLNMIDGAKEIVDYINPLGSLSASEWIWRDIIHYLLKYRYVTNWDREMRENYLPLLTEEILLKIPSNYRVKYYEHYTLPFLKDQVMKDFGIDLNTKTHYKLLLERVD